MTRTAVAAKNNNQPLQQQQKQQRYNPSRKQQSTIMVEATATFVAVGWQQQPHCHFTPLWNASVDQLQCLHQGAAPTNKTTRVIALSELNVEQNNNVFSEKINWVSNVIAPLFIIDYFFQLKSSTNTVLTQIVSVKVKLFVSFYKHNWHFLAMLIENLPTCP